MQYFSLEPQSHVASRVKNIKKFTNKNRLLSSRWIRPTEDHQKADEVLVDSQHTITGAPAFVLAVINTPPEFDPQIYWSNQIWHAISKALFAKDILMQIKPKWGNVKYPSFKITHFADFFPLLCLTPLPHFDGDIYIEKQNQRGLNRLCQIIEWNEKMEHNFNWVC